MTELLTALFSEPPAGLARLEEGLESQAFAFDVGEAAYVLRIAASSRGFEKDRWAAATAGEHVPVPAVEAIGALDDRSAYCVTRRLPGVTVESLARDEAARVTGAVHDAWRALGRTDVSAFDGFGDFDAHGRASARTWHEVLAATLASADADDDPRVLDAYTALIDRCPEERSLVHGDFGSNNVLVQDGSVTGVLDWEEALVGDPLHDVANARFWATHLPCMELQAAHFDRALAATPAYEDRVRCYALRIGIEETREARREGDSELAAWAAARCRELASS